MTKCESEVREKGSSRTLMLAKSLYLTEYDETGWNPQSQLVANPTWEQIDASIRRLDKFSFPFVWIYLRPDADPQDVPEFEVIGGAGDYVVACSVEGYHQRRVLVNDDAHDEIEVWTSDQGATASGKHVLHDVDAVLRITRHFCETGGFDPLSHGSAAAV
jgi:hypothetical protein